MYRNGHWGAALLAYAPLGFWLIVAGEPTLALLGGGVALSLARLPDVDLRIPGLTHRGSTHTLAFALLVGGALGGVGRFVGVRLALDVPVGLGVLGLLVGTLAVVSHLLADVLTPSGVALLWPLSSRRYSVGLVRASNPVANYALLGSGVLVAVGAFVLGLRVA